MEKALAKFSVLEVARTGKICLKRGEQLLEVGGWGDGLLRQRKQRESLAAQQHRQEQVSVCMAAWAWLAWQTAKHCEESSVRCQTKVTSSMCRCHS